MGLLSIGDLLVPGIEPRTLTYKACALDLLSHLPSKQETLFLFFFLGGGGVPLGVDQSLFLALCIRVTSGSG